MKVITSSTIDESQSWLAQHKLELKQRKPRIKRINIKINGIKTQLWECANGVTESGIGLSAREAYYSFLQRRLDSMQLIRLECE